MKTSELKKHIKDIGFNFEETDGYIIVPKIMKIAKGYDSIKMFHDLVNTTKLYELMKVAIEYSKTPIKEREDEKKYYIECNIKGSGKSTLRLLSTVQGYYLHEMTYTYFTKEGIEGLPTPIQRAIDCGFLEKVEVKE